MEVVAEPAAAVVALHAEPRRFLVEPDPVDGVTQREIAHRPTALSDKNSGRSFPAVAERLLHQGEEVRQRIRTLWTIDFRQ